MTEESFSWVSSLGAPFTEITPADPSAEAVGSFRRLHAVALPLSVT